MQSLNKILVSCDCCEKKAWMKFSEAFLVAGVTYDNNTPCYCNHWCSVCNTGKCNNHCICNLSIKKD